MNEFLTLKYHLIEFACTKADPIEKYVISDKRWDRWIIAEPQEGYFHYKYLGEVTVMLDAYDGPPLNLLDTDGERLC